MPPASTPALALERWPSPLPRRFPIPQLALERCCSTATALTAFGSFALLPNISGVGNTSIGGSALFNNVSTGNGLADGNTAVGHGALLSNTDASENTAVGDGALFNNDTTGNGLATINTAVGAI